MPNYAKMRTGVLILDPVASGSVTDNNAIFADSSSGSISNKDNSGTVSASSASLYQKVMQSGFNGDMPINTPVSKAADGRVVPADANSPDGQNLCGFLLAAMPSINSTALVHLIGPNAAGAIAGLGFTPGDEIYISEAGGQYTNDPNTITNTGDSIIKIGMADCAAGAASSTATDLIVMPEVIARP